MRRLLVLLMACATAPAEPTKPPAPPPSARSSLAAVLLHSGELQLSQEQQDALEKLDEALFEKQEALRAQANQRKETEPAPMQQPMGGGRGRGAMRGGGRSAAARSVGPDSQALRDKMDDNDTGAYLEGEKVLSEEQKGPARQIASKYREELFNYRASKQ
jgi:hypothetical protein